MYLLSGKKSSMVIYYAHYSGKTAPETERAFSQQRSYTGPTIE